MGRLSVRTKLMGSKELLDPSGPQRTPADPSDRKEDICLQGGVPHGTDRAIGPCGLWVRAGRAGGTRGGG